MNFVKRYLSTQTPKIAVIGSGPSSFYTTLKLLEHNSNLRIDMFEKNPSPFGLVRYGVAPDHPEVKNCIDRFNEIENFSDRFKYYGNVNVGKDITLSDISKNYNKVLFGYGASRGREPSVAGMKHPGVINSFDFVGWYNGFDQFRDLNVPLNKVKNVIIIGNGNVSIDIARLLLSGSERWENTDIYDGALEALKTSTVEKVTIVGRRGVLESKFTNKEFRELLELPDSCLEGWHEERFADQLKDVKLGRIEKRRVSLLERHSNDDCGSIDNARKWELKYLLEPIGIKVKDDQFIEDVIFKENELVKNEDTKKWGIQSKGKITSIKGDLVIFATGYECEPLAEFQDLNIAFNEQRSLIENDDGKIRNCQNFYVVGWLKTGATGNINSTVLDSSIVAGTILKDLEEEVASGQLESKEGGGEIDKLLQERQHRVVNWADWQRIHQSEVANAQNTKKPFVKMDFRSMLNV